jgi:hypothetical protein
MVRLARLPGMPPEEDPSPEEIFEKRQALNDPGMMQKALDDMRDQRENPDLTADQLTEELWLYPRYRPATVAYVDRTEGKGGQYVNLDVFTPGSPVLQMAVGRIPKYAMQHFRLDRVQMFVKEPGADDPEDGSHTQHVAFWPPETEEEAPAKKESKK